MSIKERQFKEGQRIRVVDLQMCSALNFVMKNLEVY